MPSRSCCDFESLVARSFERRMPVTFWWDVLEPSKRDLGTGASGLVQVFVVVPGGRRVIFEPSAEVYFSTCKLWNDSLSIHRLPTEVLSYIFLLAITPRGLERDPSAYPLARVCSFWRAVILDTPAFWTTISNRSSWDAAELKISRSRSSKLDFVYSPRSNYRGPFLQGTQFTQLIDPHILRCNSFRFRISKRHNTYDWAYYTSKGSYIPRLIMESADNSLQHVEKDSIPGEIQNVYLKNINVPWQSISFPKLLSLQLSGAIGFSPNSKSSLDMILEIIRACPCLKALRLGPFQDTYIDPYHTMYIESKVESFPSLESLEMEGASLDLFGQVLWRIDFPRLSKLLVFPDPNLVYQSIVGAVCQIIGGRSLLQSVIDRANCERLTIYVRRGPKAGIAVRGMIGARRVIDIDPLLPEIPTAESLTFLRVITSPADIKISGDTDGSFIRSLKETSINAGRYRWPYSQEDGCLKVDRMDSIRWQSRQSFD